MCQVRLPTERVKTFKEANLKYTVDVDDVGVRKRTRLETRPVRKSISETGADQRRA